MKKLKKKDFILISIPCILILIYILILVLKGFYFGSNVDWENQHIIIPEYFRNLFYSTGKLIPDFALNLGMGQNIYNLSYYGLLSPVILLSYFFPFIPMYIYIQIISIIMLFLSIFLIYRFINDKYDSKIAFLVTFIFALCGPMVFHSHRHIMFVIYMPFLIGALKSIDVYFDKRNPVSLIIYTLLIILSSYYFSIPSIICLGIYTIYKVLKNNKDYKRIFRVIFYVIIAILTSGVLLIPTIYALLNGRLDTNTSTNIWSLFVPKINYNLSLYYSYSLGLTFIYLISLVYGFISKKRENIFLSIVLSICALFPIASYILNGFMYVDGKCFIPFLPIALIMLSELLNDILYKKINYKKLFLLIIPVAIYFIIYSVNYSLRNLLYFDILLCFLSLFIIYKTNKKWLVYPLIISISVISFIKINLNENYAEKRVIDEQNNNAYAELLSDIKSYYRTSNEDLLLNNVNKTYDSKQLLTTFYSSSVNKNYVNFIRNIFNNEVYNKDNTTITQSSNVLFNIYSATRYLLSKNDPPIGYKALKEIDGITLYENDDVLPMGYASDKIMSKREFETLSYPEKLDALLNYIIIDKSLDNVYKSNIKEYNHKYELLEVSNMNYNAVNDHIVINADANAKLKLKLSKPISNEVLIISFKMNKEKQGKGCSTDITINGMNNSLSCSNWKYHNNNYTFEYVLSSNNTMDILNIDFSKGDYDISDISIHTLNYNKIKDIKNNIDEFIIDENLTDSNVIAGDINVSADGFFKLTIPYDSGFKIYVDGERVAKVYADESFIGCLLEKGYHHIEFKYVTPGLKLGYITSAIGIVLLIAAVFYRYYESLFKKVTKKLSNYFTWLWKNIKKFYNNNKGYIYLFISLFIIDFSLRFFYSSQVNYYHSYNLVPNLFSILWILFVLFITKLFKDKIGKTIYLIFYILNFILFVTHAIYFSYFKLYFDFSVLAVAGEGADYFDSVLLNIKYWVVIVSVISIYLTIRGLKKINHYKKFNLTRCLIIICAFIILHSSLPLMLGKKSNELNWDEWRNARSIYETFNDNNKSMMVSGMFEYNVRNFISNYFKDKESLNEEEEKALKENFDNSDSDNSNYYTGAFKGKNLIIVQLESIDSFLLDKDIMPTFYKLSKESINFTNHYSFTSGGGSTFNSEFMVNTGYSTAYNYNANAYVFSKNNYHVSLPNLLKNYGYTTNAFHMNSAEYYSRGVNYKAFGYDNYYGLKDQNIYDKNEYWLDTELLKNDQFYEKIFNNDSLSMSYIITYSAHMPYKTTKGVCQMLSDVDGLTEYECLKLQAKETDDMLGLLIENLENNNMLDNTVLVLFSDHYIYTLEDKSLLDKYKETDNNLINYTPFMIWSNGQIVKNVSSVNSQLDILPTILNLFGIDYSTNDYIGRDILDPNYDGIVFFSDGSWYNGKTYVANGEYLFGNKISDEKLAYYNNLVKNKMSLNDAVLKSDYFSKIVEDK